MHFLKTIASALLAVSVTATPIWNVPRDEVSGVGASTLNSLDARNDIKMTTATLLKAMADASSKMVFTGKFELIVQGGAVNVALGKRHETGDMDFIATNYVTGPEYSETLDELKRAWKYALDESIKAGQPIDPKWADNTIQFFFHDKPELFQKYKTAALSQNTILSNAEVDEDDGHGITYYAAAFDWQFVGKMVNMGTVEKPNKPYDFKDAADYLTEWLGKNSAKSITYGKAYSWFGDWSQTAPSNLPALCTELNRQAGSDLITGIPSCNDGLVARFDGPSCNITLSG